MRRKRLFGLMGVIVAFGLIGCAGEDDVDRTQPNRLPKSLFSGTWYIRTVVTDVPGTSAAAFIGQTGNMEKIRWEIQENHLIARRAYQEIPGTDRTNQRNAQPDEYMESPIAVFPIESHFDIKRDYNPATGEQTNVIGENTSDRPWYERDYIRVDWSQSEIDPMTFEGYAGGINRSATYFVQQHEDDPDAMRFVDMEGQRVLFDELSTLSSRKPSEWGDQVEYFDMVGRYLLDPDYVNYTWEDGTSMKIPLCYFIRYGGSNMQTHTCGPTQVKIRTAFMKVGDRNYEPVALPDREMGKFGYFRTERFTWDKKYGFTEEGRIYLANLHNIWKAAYREGADGTRELIPVAEREPKPIVYHLNKDYPCDLVNVAKRIEHSYDMSYRRAVAVAKGLITSTTGEIETEMAQIPLDQVPQMFKIDLNGWTQINTGDDWSCGNLQRDPTQEVAYLGDLRFNFVYWVPERQISGPLGYGPSSADPETGEIVAGMAHVYGAAVDEYSNRSLELVRMLMGDLNVDNMSSGDYVRNYIQNNKPVIDPAKIPAEIAKLKGPEIREKLFLSDKMKNKLAAIREHGLEKATIGARSRRLARIQGTALEENLLDDEVVRTMAPYFAPDADPTNPSTIPDQVRRLMSPLNWDSYEARTLDRLRRDKAMQKTIWLAEFADDGIQGLAMETWKKFGGEGGAPDYDAMWQFLREQIFQGVMEHEIGHTVGLRHNFAGSYDSVNYHNPYWSLREENLIERDPTQSSGALQFDQLYAQYQQTQTQVDNKMREYQYSSIMDYGNKFNSDVHGLGKYDHAAITFGYGGYVEVFNQAQPNTKIIMRQRYSDCTSRYESTPNLAYSPVLEQWHYSSIWNLLGKKEGLFTRRFRRWADVKKEQDDAQKACEAFVQSGGQAWQFNQQQDGDRDLEVPYMFCSDEYYGATASCQLWDMGADPFEIAQNFIDTYKSYYFFNNFKRGRFGFDSYNVYSRVSGRYFSYLPNIYQHWLFRAAFSGLDDDTLFNYWTIGTWNGFNLLNEVIATPQYGVYCRGGWNSQTQKCANQGDEWVLVDRDPMSIDQGNEVILGKGYGRRRYSLFDYESGYYYQDKILESGHFWEYLAALYALTSSTGVFVGVETGTDFTTYLVPYYILFEDELVESFEGVVAEDYDKYAPRVVINGSGVPEVKQVPRAVITFSNGQAIDPATGQPLDGLLGGQVVDLDNWFTLKFYTLLLGMSEFRSLYSLNYADRHKVFRLGAGEAFEPAPGFDVAMCDDPVGGHRYAAVYDPNDPGSQGGAVQILKKCADEAAAYRAATGDQAKLNAKVRMEEQIEWANFMRGLYELFGNNAL